MRLRLELCNSYKIWLIFHDLKELIAMIWWNVVSWPVLVKFLMKYKRCKYRNTSHRFWVHVIFRWADERDSFLQHTRVTVTVTTAQYGLTHHVRRDVIHRTVSVMSKGANIDGFKIRFSLTSSLYLSPSNSNQVVSRQFYGPSHRY